MVLILAMVGLVVNIALWFLIARRANTGGKWALVALTILGIVLTIYDFAIEGYAGLTKTYIVMENAAGLLTLVANWFLFRPDALLWFSSQGTEGEIDPQVFH